jgi:hypothetical protein
MTPSLKRALQTRFRVRTGKYGAVSPIASTDFQEAVGKITVDTDPILSDDQVKALGSVSTVILPTASWKSVEAIGETALVTPAYLGSPLREKGYLTTVKDGNNVTNGPVTVIGTGETPFDMTVILPTASWKSVEAIGETALVTPAYLGSLRSARKLSEPRLPLQMSAGLVLDIGTRRTSQFVHETLSGGPYRQLSCRRLPGNPLKQ